MYCLTVIYLYICLNETNKQDDNYNPNNRKNFQQNS